MIEKSAGYTSNGEDFHATLEEAQDAALVALFNELTTKIPGSAVHPSDMASFAIEHSDEIVAILTTKHKGRPRNTKGATTMRKAKLRTAALPLAEKEAQP